MKNSYRIYYLDDYDNIVSEDKATKFIAREEDSNGNLVNETYGYVNDKYARQVNPGDKGEVYATQETLDFLKNENKDKDLGNFKVMK